MTVYIDIHSHTKSTINSKVLYNLKRNELPDNKYDTFGIHPWDIGNIVMEDYFDKLTEYCNKGKIIALGEIGIDRSIQQTIEMQIDVFVKQHVLAEKYKLPVIIHCVKAWSDLLEIRKKLNTNLPWIFHCYNGNLKTAQQLILKGCYLSFGHILLENEKLQQVFTSIPLEYIFLETDNSHVTIEMIYQKAAYLLQMEIHDLKLQLHKNFDKIFEIGHKN